MMKLFKERKLFKEGNYMRKYGMCKCEVRLTKRGVRQGVGALYSLPSDYILKILTELSFSSVFLPNRYLQKLLYLWDVREGQNQYLHSNWFSLGFFYLQ